MWLNGAPAGRLEFDGELSGAVSLVVENGHVTRVYTDAKPATSAQRWTSRSNPRGGEARRSPRPLRAR